MNSAVDVTPISASIMQSPPPCPCGSGKTFDFCHGSLPLPPPPTLAPEPKLVKLDFGCGQRPMDGFEGVDLYAPDAKHQVDLWKFPLPWADSSVDEIYCSHFVEHLPARDVTNEDIVETKGLRYVKHDFFLAFFDECYRILKPGGLMRVIVPALQSVRAFQDPTHRRFICAETFMYLNKEWRELQKLDHYNVCCDFAGTVNHTCESEMNQRVPEVAARMFRHDWNTMYDFHVDLIKR